jgi:hypothetical protein
VTFLAAVFSGRLLLRTSFHLTADQVRPYTIYTLISLFANSTWPVYSLIVRQRSIRFIFALISLFIRERISYSNGVANGDGGTPVSQTSTVPLGRLLANRFQDAQNTIKLSTHKLSRSPIPG